MSFLTTNPSPVLLNLPAFQNVANSSTGISDSVQLLDTTNYSLQINTINTIDNTAFLTIQKDTNFSNANIYMNGTEVLTSNSINGIDSIAFQVNGIEQSRLNGTGFGIGTNDPTKLLHVAGDGIITGNLYVSGTINPSDPILKDNIQPYTISKLPEPVSFTWKATGKRDIGVLANDIQSIEPSCVETNDGVMGVNYPKLVVLCLAELKMLRTKIESLEFTIAKLQAGNSVLQQ